MDIRILFKSDDDAIDRSTDKLDKMSRSGKKAGSDIDNGMKRAKRSTNALQSSLGRVKSLLAIGFAAVGIKSLATDLFETAMATDKMRAMLKTATGTVDKASEAFDRLTEFAKKTPFTLDQSVNGFIKLKNLGLKPTERAMTAFGNISAAMGKDMMQMIEAVADASTNEFERLKEFGIKSKQQGEFVTFTFQGVETKIRKTSDNIKEYLIGLGETRFAGAMADQMDSLGGKVSNMKDGFGALFRQISDMGATDIFKQSIQIIINATAALSGHINDASIAWAFFVDDLKYGEGIYQLVRDAFNQLSSALAFIAGKLGFIVEPMGKLAGAFGIVVSVMAGSVATWSLVAAGIGLVTTAVRAMTLAMLSNPIIAVIAGIATAAYLIYDNWGSIKTWWADMWTGMKSLAADFLGWWNSTTLAQKALDISTAPIKSAISVSKELFNWWNQSTLKQWTLAVISSAVSMAQDVSRRFSSWWNSWDLKEFTADVTAFVLIKTWEVSQKFSSWWSSWTLKEVKADVSAVLVEKAWEYAKRFANWWNNLTLKSIIPDIQMPSIAGLKARASGIGKNISEGFAQGISRARAHISASKNMANQSLSAMRKTLRTRSPSKAAEEIGIFYAQGFAGGIDKHAKLAFNAAQKMAKSTNKALKEAIASEEHALKQSKIMMQDGALAAYESELANRRFGKSKQALSAATIKSLVAQKAENIQIKKHIEQMKTLEIASKNMQRVLKQEKDSITARNRELTLTPLQNYRKKLDDKGIKKGKTQDDLVNRRAANDSLDRYGDFEKEQLRYQTDLELLESAQAQKIEAVISYQHQREMLEQQHNANLLKLKKKHHNAAFESQFAGIRLQVGAAQQGAEALMNVLEASGKKQSKLYAAAFKIRKAAALATATIDFAKGMSFAMSLGFPLGIPAGVATVAQYATVLGKLNGATYAGAYKHGGDFVVGGSGGEDSQRIFMDVTPGEQVSVKTKQQQQQGSNNNAPAPIVLNVYEDAAKAGNYQQSEIDGQRVIDLWVANWNAHGEVSDAVTSGTGTRRVGGSI